MLHYYGEETAAAAHLGLCPECRSEYHDLSRLLDACRQVPVPEPAGSFETLTWQKIAPELRKRRTPWWKQNWMLAPAMATLLVAAFFVGRVSIVTPPAAQTASPQGRDRILLVALGDHLQRSQMVLVELANVQPADSQDIRLTQERARDLVSANRLYRQSALISGDHEFVGLLDDLERVLTDIANSPSRISSPELLQIQQRIESRGLIFKIRVIYSTCKKKEPKNYDLSPLTVYCPGLARRFGACAGCGYHVQPSPK